MAVSNAVMPSSLASVRGEQESRGGGASSPQRISFLRLPSPLQQDMQVNSALGKDRWGKGAWREKVGPFDELFALSLQPLMVGSMFALCSGIERVFLSPGGVYVFPQYPLAPLAAAASAEYLL